MLLHIIFFRQLPRGEYTAYYDYILQLIIF